MQVYKGNVVVIVVVFKDQMHLADNSRAIRNDYVFFVMRSCDSILSRLKWSYFLLPPAQRPFISTLSSFPLVSSPPHPTPSLASTISYSPSAVLFTYHNVNSNKGKYAVTDGRRRGAKYSPGPLCSYLSRSEGLQWLQKQLDTYSPTSSDRATRVPLLHTISPWIVGGFPLSRVIITEYTTYTHITSTSCWRSIALQQVSGPPVAILVLGGGCLKKISNTGVRRLEV